MVAFILCVEDNPDHDHVGLLGIAMDRGNKKTNKKGVGIQITVEAVRYDIGTESMTCRKDKQSELPVRVNDFEAAGLRKFA